MKFDLIVCDAPWRFGDKLTMSDVKRGADANYDTMPLADIIALPVEKLAAKDAVLGLWVPSSMLQDGLDVMKAYGFKQKQIYTWMKASRNPAPPPKATFRSAREAFVACLETSQIDGYDSSASDVFFLQGRDPGPFEGGHFDEINLLLELTGDDRVRGASHAFAKLLNRGHSWVDAQPAIDLLKRVPGLERLRMPDEIAEALLASEEIEQRGWLEAKQAFGMGYHFRGCTEHALVGTRGKPKPVSRSQRNAHLSPAMPHSVKPEEFQDRLEAMYPTARKLEMFARRKREGWTTIGNECEGTIGVDIRDWCAQLIDEKIEMRA
jgi:N6-adenosine-specific RNA methylase IME4